MLLTLNQYIEDYNIQYRMYYKRGDVVLVKIENYPFWPAEIARIRDGELYNVMFYGEKSEAIVHATAVKEMTWERGKALEREANLTKNKKLRVAIRLAQKKLGERGKKHLEGDENLSKTLKSRQKGRSVAQSQPKQLENAKNHLFGEQEIVAHKSSPEHMDIQSSPSIQEQKMGSQYCNSAIFNIKSQLSTTIQSGKQILRNQYEYDSLRSLLKKYSLGLININSYSLSLKEKDKMVSLLIEKELLLSESIEYWIIEQICSIVTFVCFRGIPNENSNKDIINLLINYFTQIKLRIYSNELDNFYITAQRKKGLISRVRLTDSYLQNPLMIWGSAN